MRMMKQNILCYIVIFILLFGFGATAQSGQTLFESGNKLYNDGKYQDAIAAYEAILEGEQHSAEVYFNLANTYYKLNQIAPSIYYYEKALQLSPKDSDIKNNLVFAQNMTIDAIENIPEVGFAKISRSITNVFSADQWAVIAVLFMMIFVICFLMYYFSFGTNKKRFLFLSSFSALFLCLLAVTLAFQKFEIDKRNNPAIVFAQQSEVRSDPNLRSETAFELHEGTKVQVLENYDENWTKIQLSDGKTGWIPSSDIKLLNRF